MPFDTVTDSKTSDNLLTGGFPVKKGARTLSTGDLSRGAVLGKILYGAVTAVANVGNTGDGTCTALATVVSEVKPVVGAYNLECTAVGGTGVAAGTATPGGGNTGDGTVTALAITTGGAPKVGTFNLTCTDDNAGGTASGTAAFVGTGNGTCSAVTTGADTEEGAYVITCTDASVSGSEIFEVITPSGAKLEDLTVGVAYLNDHLGLTLTDGSTDFIVGDAWTVTVAIEHGGKFTLFDPTGAVVDSTLTLPGGAGGTLAVSAGGIDFTITDGATDFAVDDTFAITTTATESGGGTFKLVDPNGALVASDLIMSIGALTATVFETAGLTFTLTDGATDFAVADKFAVTVAAGTEYVTLLDKTAVDGSQYYDSVLLEDTDASLATAVCPVAETGEFNTIGLSFASGTVAADVVDDMRTKSCFQVTSTALVGV